MKGWQILAAAAGVAALAILGWTTQHGPPAAPTAPSANVLPAGEVARTPSLAAAPDRVRDVPPESLSTRVVDVARSDPLTALRAAIALPPTSERDELCRHAARQWAAIDAPAAAAWAHEIEGEAIRGEILQAIVAVWSDHDSRAAAEFTATRFPPGLHQAQAASALASEWASRDLPGAAAWVAGFPESPGRQAATEAVVVAWAAHDSAAVTAWAGALQDSAHRDLAHSLLAQSIAPRDPAAAARLAALITDPALRERCRAVLAAAGNR